MALSSPGRNLFLDDFIATRTVAVYRYCDDCAIGFWDQGYDDQGQCDHCDGPYCSEHIFTADSTGDDGSGQYVTELGGMYCEPCIASMQEPVDPEFDY